MSIEMISIKMLCTDSDIDITNIVFVRTSSF